MSAHINDRRLYRSRSDRMISGVCGGLGQYFSIDPVIIRLAFVLVTLAGGAGLLAYIILALVVPEEGAGATGQDALRQNAEGLRSDAETMTDNLRADATTMASDLRTGRNRELGGLILVGIGLYFIAHNLGLLDWLGWWFNWGTLWPLILIGLGVAILLRRNRDNA